MSLYDQRPLGSGFGPTTTATEALDGVDLGGKLAIVTGGYSGLGLAAAVALARAGAEVIVAARDRRRAAEALRDLPQIEVESLDLAAPASIDAFADRFLAGGRPLHLLVNNAAIMAAPLARDARGCESQFATNHLGHFQLTCRLAPALLRAGKARVVSVSSRAQVRWGMDFEDPHFERRDYDPWAAYGQSKTANALFAVALDARGRNGGVRAFSAHPGTIMTNLGRSLSAQALQAIGMIDARGRPVVDPARDRKTAEQGAATIVWCAASPSLDGLGGLYCEDCDVAMFLPADAPDGAGVRPWACDPVLAERLWTLSAELAGVDFEVS